MRETYLFTKDKITAERITQKILNEYPYSKKIHANNEGQLYLGKFPHTFDIDFDYSFTIDSGNYLFGDYVIKDIPFENAFVISIRCNSFKAIRALIKIIKDEYPELMIWNENNSLLTPDEYVRVSKYWEYKITSEKLSSLNRIYLISENLLSLEYLNTIKRGKMKFKLVSNSVLDEDIIEDTNFKNFSTIKVSFDNYININQFIEELSKKEKSFLIYDWKYCFLADPIFFKKVTRYWDIEE